MTTIQFANALLDDTRFDEITAVPLEKQMQLLATINGAIQQYFELAPNLYKRTTATTLLPAPEYVDHLQTTPGSTAVAAGSFLPDQIGQTVIIEGDGTLNEIVDTDTLLRPFQGSYTADKATVYYDSWTFFDMSVEKLSNELHVLHTDGTRTPVRRISAPGFDERATHSPHNSYGESNWFFSAMDRQKRSFGSFPSVYGVQPVGASRASGAIDSAFRIQVNPIPDCAVTLEAQIDQLPLPYVIENLTHAPKELPIPAERFYSQLLPLARKRLVSTSLWKGGSTQIQGIMAEAKEAREAIRSLPRHFAPPKNTLGTRRGF